MDKTLQWQLTSSLQFHGVLDAEAKDYFSAYEEMFMELRKYVNTVHLTRYAIQLKQQEISLKKWKETYEKGKEVIEGWNPKWNEFVHSVRQGEWSQSVKDFFLDTKLVYAGIVANPTTTFSLYLAKDDELFELEINDAAWGHVSLHKASEVPGYAGLMRMTQNISPKEEIAFGKKLREFGMIELCEEVNFLVDHDSPKRASRTEEQNAEMDAKRKFFQSEPMVSLFKKMLNEE